MLLIPLIGGGIAAAILPTRGAYVTRKSSSGAAPDRPPADAPKAASGAAIGPSAKHGAFGIEKIENGRDALAGGGINHESTLLPALYKTGPD